MHFVRSIRQIEINVPTEVCLDGAKARIGTKREDLPWIETEETFEGEFKQWIEDFSEKQLPEIYSLLEKYRDKEIVVFRSREDADVFISLL